MIYYSNDYSDYHKYLIERRKIKTALPSDYGSVKINAQRPRCPNCPVGQFRQRLVVKDGELFCKNCGMIQSVNCKMLGV